MECTKQCLVSYKNWLINITKSLCRIFKLLLPPICLKTEPNGLEKVWTNSICCSVNSLRLSFIFCTWFICSHNCKKIKQKKDVVTVLFCSILKADIHRCLAPYSTDNFKTFQENTPYKIYSQQSRRFSANQTLPRVLPQYFCGIFRIAGSKAPKKTNSVSFKLKFWG